MEAGSGKSTETVIMAYDGSAAARQAVTGAARFLGDCQILVVTIWEEGAEYLTSAIPGEMGAQPIMVDPRSVRAVDQALHQRAEDLAREGAAVAQSLGLDAQPLALPDEEGNVAATLLALARERHAAAIVVGSRGLGGIRARLEGSTSKHLLRHASCPVVVVHEAEAHDG
jgi:nucleotide-binding universal stress UspA family protein